jgi:glutathione S-transferase
MITLYVRTGCQYCARVLAVVDELNIPVTLKNIADEGVVEELMEIGGKQQEPFMVDDETETLMYESDIIEQYLRDKFG